MHIENSAADLLSDVVERQMVATLGCADARMSG